MGEFEFSPGSWEQEALVQGWLPSVRSGAEQCVPGARGPRFPGRVIRSASLEGWWERRRHELRLYSCPWARLVPEWSKTVGLWVCKAAAGHSFIGHTLSCCHRPLDELFSASEFQLPLFFLFSFSLSFPLFFLFLGLKKSWGRVAVQYHESYRHTIQWFTNFKGPFLAIRKYWLDLLCWRHSLVSDFTPVCTF